MSKLFDLSNEENMSGVIDFNSLSVEDHLHYNSAELSIEETYSDIMYNGELLSAANEAIKILENTNFEELSIEDAHTVLETVADETGYNLNITKDELSIENIIKEKEGILAKLKKMVKMLTTRISEDISAVGGFLKLLSKYDTSKLKAVKEKIKSGELVPVEKIDTKKADKLMNDLGVFYSLGYDLDGKSKDIIEFLKTPLDKIKGGYYEDTILKLTNGILFSKKQGDQVVKDEIGAKQIAMLKGVDFKVDPKSKDFITGFFVRYLDKNISLFSLVERHDRKDPGIGRFDINTDMFKATRRGKVSVFDTKEIIKLIDFGIDSKSDISDAMTKTKKMYADTFMKKTIYSIINNKLAKLIPGYGAGALMLEFIYGRYLENLANHLLILNKSFLRYDKLILRIIDVMYEKKK